MAVGILALQGAFAEHAAVLDKLGVPHFEIRQKRDLDQPMNGLIIPGGDSKRTSCIRNLCRSDSAG